MRSVLLTGSLLALLAVLFAMWAYRFERVSGLPTWRLSDFKNDIPPTPGVGTTGTADHPGLRLQAPAATGKSLAIRLAIPGAPAVEALHLRFRLTSRGLVPGRERWQDGRVMVEWHDPSGETPTENDPVGSARHDFQSGWVDLVVQPNRTPAVPALRLEHLGRSGAFELTDLRVTAVRERSLWKVGRWFLAAGWLVWAAALIRSWPGISIARASCAAAIWVVLGTQFVIPGPWKVQRPMAAAFQLGERDTKFAPPPREGPEVGVPSPETAAESGPLEALGKLPDQGSLVLRIKLAVSRARPLLHAALLFAPTLAWVVLVGRRPALILAVSLAVAIELAQIAFGYGFDWVDAGDLACDAAGIVLALWVGKRVITRSKVVPGRLH